MQGTQVQGIAQHACTHVKNENIFITLKEMASISHHKMHLRYIVASLYGSLCSVRQGVKE